jgi:hypothetical protein
MISGLEEKRNFVAAPWRSPTGTDVVDLSTPAIEFLRRIKVVVERWP